MRTFLQVLSLSLVLVSSIFLIRSVLTADVKQMAALSGTYWNFNPHMIQSLAQQKADTMVGFILLLLSFLLQTANLLWPMRWCDFAVSRKGTVVAVIVSLVLFLTSLCIARIYANKIAADITEIHKSNKISKK